MKLRTSLPPVAAGLVAALALGGCGSASGGAEDEITIGVVTSLSGPGAPNSKQIQNGYETAVAEFNKQGGLQVKLEFSDAATPAEGASAAQRLITSKGADLLVGTYSSAVSATASETAARLKTVYWETSALSSELTERDLPNFFRIGFSADDFGRALADSAALFEEATGKDIGDTKFYIEHEDSTYGTTIAEAEAAAVEAMGGQLVGMTSHQASASDLTGTVLKTKKADPDVWLLANYIPDQILLLRTAEQQNFRPQAIVTTGGAWDSLFEALGPEGTEGFLNLGYPHDVSPGFAPGSEDFLDEYQATVGEEPKLPQALNGYSGMKAILDILAETDGDTSIEAVSKAAMALDEPFGTDVTGGGVKFDAHRQNERAAIIFDQAQSGTAKVVFPADAALKGTDLVPTDGS